MRVPRQESYSLARNRQTEFACVLCTVIDAHHADRPPREPSRVQRESSVRGRTEETEAKCTSSLWRPCEISGPAEECRPHADAPHQRAAVLVRGHSAGMTRPAALRSDPVADQGDLTEFHAQLFQCQP